MADYTGKTDRELLVEIYTNMEHITGIIEDHEGRLDSVETTQDKQTGGILTASAIVGILSAKIAGWF